jgi:hypothetical protein
LTAYRCGSAALACRTGPTWWRGIKGEIIRTFSGGDAGAIVILIRIVFV